MADAGGNIVQHRIGIHQVADACGQLFCNGNIRGGQSRGLAGNLGRRLRARTGLCARGISDDQAEGGIGGVRIFVCDPCQPEHQGRRKHADQDDKPRALQHQTKHTEYIDRRIFFCHSIYFPAVFICHEVGPLLLSSSGGRSKPFSSRSRSMDPASL